MQLNGEIQFCLTQLMFLYLQQRRCRQTGHRISLEGIPSLIKGDSFKIGSTWQIHTHHSIYRDNVHVNWDNYTGHYSAPEEETMYSIASP